MPLRTIVGPWLVGVIVLGGIVVAASLAVPGARAAAQQSDAATAAGDETAQETAASQTAADGAAAQVPQPTVTTDPAGPGLPNEPPSAEAKALQEQYHQKRLAWVDTLTEIRRIQIRYNNNDDQSPESMQQYRTLRDRSRAEIRELFSAAEQLFAVQHQDVEAGSMLATTLDYRRVKSMYDGSFHGAKMLIEAGADIPDLYLVAARSAFIDGHFDEVMPLYHRLLGEHGEEKIEKVDRQIGYSLDFYPQWWEEELEYRRADAEANLPRVLLETSRGPVVIELFEDRAPNTVANFINMVEQGFYDGTEFYQVIDDLLAMGGDPVGDGTGTSGRFIPDEHDRGDRRRIFRGSLFMAKMPDGRDDGSGYIPDTASSQFIIALMPMTPREQTQTVFGRVVEGMDVVCSFQRVDPQKKKESQVQLPPDRIERASVIRKRDHDYSVTYTR